MAATSLAMGYEASWVSQFLAGRRALPTPDAVKRLAPVLAVPLVELLDEAWGIAPGCWPRSSPRPGSIQICSAG